MDREERMTYNEAYQRGRTFPAFLDGVQANRDMWHAMARRALLDASAVERIATVEGHWRMLVLVDDWCGDGVNTVPIIAKLADAAPNLDLRILGREEIPEIMDRHLTRGSRSIPVVVLLDEEGRERGWWGPRPRPLQEWFEKEGRALDKAERYPELRRWYARDRGETTSAEVAELVWCGAQPGVTHYRGTRPCEKRVA
jgi:hypothetical protein